MAVASRRPSLAARWIRIRMNDVSSQNEAAAVSRKRGRPSREVETEITNAITQTALQMFLEEGYGATSMKRVAEVAQVSPGTLYARFANKEALFKAVVELEVATLKISHPLRRPKAGASLIDVLESSAINMMDALGRQDVEAFGRLLANEAGRFPQLARIYQQATGVAQDDMEAWMLGAHDSALTPDDAADLHTTLRETVLGWSRLRIFTAPSQRGSIRPEARRIARILGRGWTRA